MVCAVADCYWRSATKPRTSGSATLIHEVAFPADELLDNAQGLGRTRTPVATAGKRFLRQLLGAGALAEESLKPS